MPSKPVRTKKGIFYRRKGGAWIRRRGIFIHVGKGKGNWSLHDIRKDRKRKAKENAKLAKRYPQAYDHPRKKKRKGKVKRVKKRHKKKHKR